MPFLEPSELKRRLGRSNDWLNNRLQDGPLCMVTVPPPGDVWQQLVKRFPTPAAGDMPALRRWWMDREYVTARVAAFMEANTYLGDAWPYHYVNLGPGALAAFMGCEAILQPTTVWQEPLVEDWSNPPKLELKEDAPLWLAAQELTRASLAASGGRWVTSVTDIGGAMDITSYFRNPERLCYDLIESPEAIKMSEEAVLKAWFQVFDRLAEMVLKQTGGTSSWGMTWGLGRHYMLQCDFSCMIGPAMFREFVLPVLTRMAAGLDACCYHLDGPDAIRHVDDICAVPKINCIQWVCGAGASPAVANWLDLYKRIQANGCGLYTWCWEKDLETAINNLDIDRLMLVIGPDPGQRPFTLEQGQAVMRKVERLCKGRRRTV